MQVLDADKGERLESSTGRVATRDIVQFVPMRDVQSMQYFICKHILSVLSAHPFRCRCSFYVIPFIMWFWLYS